MRVGDHRYEPHRIGDFYAPVCPSCGKVCHETRDEARFVALVYRMMTGDYLDHFYCERCSTYHVGHRAKRMRRRGEGRRRARR